MRISRKPARRLARKQAAAKLGQSQSAYRTNCRIRGTALGVQTLVGGLRYQALSTLSRRSKRRLPLSSPSDKSLYYKLRLLIVKAQSYFALFAVNSCGG